MALPARRPTCPVPEDGEHTEGERPAEGDDDNDNGSGTYSLVRDIKPIQSNSQRIAAVTWSDSDHAEVEEEEAPSTKKPSDKANLRAAKNTDEDIPRAIKNTAKGVPRASKAAGKSSSGSLTMPGTSVHSVGCPCKSSMLTACPLGPFSDAAWLAACTSKKAKDHMRQMIKDGNWQFNPIPVFDMDDNLVPLRDYSTKLKGAIVHVKVVITHHFAWFDNRTDNYYADIQEMTIISPGTIEAEYSHTSKKVENALALLKHPRSDPEPDSEQRPTKKAKGKAPVRKSTRKSSRHTKADDKA